jgi:hypothetical protein
VAQRVDLNHQAKRDPTFVPEFDQAIEDRLPLLVAGKIIVGDEELVNAVRPVKPHEMLHVIRRAVARLAALHVDDCAERALVRAASARVETRAEAERPCHIPFREERHGRPLQTRQVLHEVVHRCEPTLGRIAQHHVEPALGLTREHGDAHVPTSVEIDRPSLEHRQASRHVEASDGDGNPSLPERSCDVEGARILVGLNADERNKPKIAVTPKASEQRRHVYAHVCLVDHLDVDGDVRPKDLPLGAIGRDAVHSCKRIRGDQRAPPADHISVSRPTQMRVQNVEGSSPTTCVCLISDYTSHRRSHKAAIERSR